MGQGDWTCFGSRGLARYIPPGLIGSQPSAPAHIRFNSSVHDYRSKTRGFSYGLGANPTIISFDAGFKPGKSDIDFLIHLFYIEGTKMMSSICLDPVPVPVPINIPTIPGTNDVSPHIPAVVHQGPAEQGLPVIGQAEFTDVLQLTTIAVPMDCTSSGKKNHRLRLRTVGRRRGCRCDSLSRRGRTRQSRPKLQNGNAGCHDPQTDSKARSKGHHFDQENGSRRPLGAS